MVYVYGDGNKKRIGSEYLPILYALVYQRFITKTSPFCKLEKRTFREKK